MKQEDGCHELKASLDASVLAYHPEVPQEQTAGDRDSELEPLQDLSKTLDSIYSTTYIL